MDQNLELERENLRRKKKREAEEYWKKILAYYMMQKMEAERIQAADFSTEKLMGLLTDSKIRDVVALLFDVPEGRLSAMELLANINEMETEENSPFSELLQTMREEPDNREKLNKSVTRCVAEAPQRIIDRVEEEKHERETTYVPEHRIQQQDKRLNCEMALLQIVMPPALFETLRGTLEKNGRHYNPNAEYLLNRP